MKKCISPRQILAVIITLIVILLIMSSCSSSTESPTEERVTIMGTLNLPASASGKQWAVLVDNDTDGDNSTVGMNFGVCGSGTTVGYNIPNIPVGTYYIYAVVFVVSDGSGEPQPGDYVGIYDGSFPLDIPTAPNATVSASNREFDIDLTIMPDIFI